MSSWFFNEKNKPQYVAIPIENDIVKLYEIDNKYQCPVYCGTHHNHSVYFEGDSFRMVIDKNQLGKKYKEKKYRKKK